MLVTADPVLREELAGLGNTALFRTCAGFGGVEEDDDAGHNVLQATRITLSLLAQRIEQPTVQIRVLSRRLARLMEHHFPQLLAPVGIGPDSAATLVITMGDNPERLSSEASFAVLCGVSPIEHSSGRERCWRLNRGGDRQANAALHRIVYARLRFDPRTRDYFQRRRRKARRDGQSSAASDATWHARSSTWSGLRAHSGLVRMKPTGHLLYLDRMLDELDPPRWMPPAADATHLVRTVHELRCVPLDELRPADLRTLIAQQVALPYVLPLAVRLLIEEPLLDAYFYEGDLLLAAVTAPASAWALPELCARLRTVITTLPETAVAGLPRGAAEELARFVGEPAPLL
ncbi:contact-dependent growth inhibition system immunity protein [Streptomyces lomondensis]|uniref:Transposase IS116/IS110/IS902 C-terminal domain-containing protein n=2 Tax=Streptomyces lomondensis TaxID=68229 RepID=A0ABQ2XW72_9ACTN|nr:contact-dependent growth inhibition system immunity protein [Streptomyces lomondensis]MCF0083231.1 transposase [Streptomyces lomondensis]GGX37086.1 hypothetical protein GCM10010383_78830 [Streptomyces lomondensis]